MPNLIGRHNKLKNIQVDGNPLKSTRRPVIAKGSQGILAYLHDRFVESTDLIVEEWATDQVKADVLQDFEREQEKI